MRTLPPELVSPESELADVVAASFAAAVTVSFCAASIAGVGATAAPPPPPQRQNQLAPTLVFAEFFRERAAFGFIGALDPAIVPSCSPRRRLYAEEVFPVLGVRVTIPRVTNACAGFGVTDAANEGVRFPWEVSEFPDEIAGETANDVVVRLRSMIDSIDS